MGKPPAPSTPIKSVVGAQIVTTLSIPAEAITVIAAPPEMLSQKNIEAVTGIPARVYLEEIRSPGFPLKVIKLGKLRLVDRAAFVAWLRERVPPSRAANDVAEERDEVTELLAELGYKWKRAR